MKVLKQQDLSNWKHNYICLNCDSELEIVPADLKYKFYDGDCRERREPSYHKYFINCCVCGNEQSVLESKLPKRLKLELQKRK